MGESLLLLASTLPRRVKPIQPLYFFYLFELYLSIIFIQGKLTAQIGHASLGVYQTTPTDILTKWEEDGLQSRLYSGSETIIQGLIQAAQQNNIQYRNGSFFEFFY